MASSRGSRSELGDFGYQRALLAGSPTLRPGVFTYGLEYLHSDGPWEVPNDYRKVNGFLRYSMPVGEGHLALTAMAYDGNGTRPTKYRYAPSTQD